MLNKLLIVIFYIFGQVWVAIINSIILYFWTSMGSQFKRKTSQNVLV